MAANLVFGNSICKLPGCTKPVYQEAATGHLFDFCCRTHATLFKQRGLSLSASPSPSMTASSVSSNVHTPKAAVDVPRIPADNNESIWQCISCTFKNNVMLPWCEICESPRPNCSPMSIVDEQPSCAAVTKTSSLMIPHRTCPRCDYALNRSDSTHCRACFNPFAAASHILQRSLIHEEDDEDDEDTEDPEFQRILEETKQISYWDEEERKQDTWVCCTCDTTNHKNNMLCSQCNEGKVIPLERRFRSCPVCTIDNPYLVDTCTMCGHDMSLAVDIKSLDPHKKAECIMSGLPRSTCGIPGCPRPGNRFGYCSEAHRQKAADRQMAPPPILGVELVLLGDTGEYSVALLNKHHPKRESVKQQFLTNWLKADDGLPRVERIYDIQMSPLIMEKFEACKAKYGNVVRRFHGTEQLPDCMFGTKQSTAPCMNAGCKVCSICRQSFSLTHAGKGPGGRSWNNRLRYGYGLYFSPTSSKSHDYNTNSERLRPHSHGRQRRWRCMFLCNVVVGKAFETEEGFMKPEDCPPRGYQSVHGVTGKALNYDEVVVYTEEQAVPSYLIVYSLDPVP